MVHINKHVSHTDSQILILEGVIVFAACSNTCLDLCHWPPLCAFGRGGEGEKDLIFYLKNVKYNMWLRTLLLANTQGLRPCSELPFGLIGCTVAAVPVLCTAAPFLHVFLHLLAITIEIPMDVVQVLADGDFLSLLPCFSSNSLISMKTMKLINHMI